MNVTYNILTTNISIHTKYIRVEDVSRLNITFQNIISLYRKSSISSLCAIILSVQNTQDNSSIGFLHDLTAIG